MGTGLLIADDMRFAPSRAVSTGTWKTSRSAAVCWNSRLAAAANGRIRRARRPRRPDAQAQGRGQREVAEQAGVAPDDAGGESGAHVGDARAGRDDGALDLGALDVRAGADRGVGAHVGVADGGPGPDDDGAHEDAAPDLGTLVDADAALDPVGVARSLGHVGGDLVQDDPVELQQVDHFAAVGAPGVDEADVDRPLPPR